MPHDAGAAAALQCPSIPHAQRPVRRPATHPQAQSKSVPFQTAACPMGRWNGTRQHACEGVKHACFTVACMWSNPAAASFLLTYRNEWPGMQSPAAGRLACKVNATQILSRCLSSLNPPVTQAPEHNTRQEQQRAATPAHLAEPHSAYQTRPPHAQQPTTADTR